MMRALSFPASPERSRLRGWLEGTVAGLCELHLLRERQERRVRQALRIAAGSLAKQGDAGEGEGGGGGGGGGEPAAENQLDALPGLMWELEQQLGLLHLYPEKTGGEATETDSWPSSGFYEGPPSAITSDSPASGFGDSSSSFPSASGSYSRIGYSNERPKSVGDMADGSKDGAGRGKVPRSFSAPYSSSQDYAAERPPPRYPPDLFLYPSPLHAVARQNPLLQSRLYEGPAFSAAAPQGLGYPPAREAGLDPFGDEFQFYPEAASHGHKVESYISRLIRRRSQLARGGKPRTSPGTEPPAPPPKGGVARQNSACKRPAELLPPPAERKHPPAMERGSSTPSPCGHEGGAAAGGGPPTYVWSSWDAAAERTLAARAAAEDYSPPHASLQKPPTLQALAHARPRSVDPHEGPYPPSPLPGGEEERSRRDGPDPLPYESEEAAACLMVKAQYIPAQQATRAQQAHRPGKKKPPPLTKGRSVELSPDRGPPPARERPRASAPPKKCRFTEEGGEAAGRKGAGRKSSPRSRKAARSQSENSLLNKPGVKYGTAEREEAASKPARPRRPHAHPAGGYRKWRSTAEICQEEPPAGGVAEPRRAWPGPGAAGYGYAGSDSECSGEPARQAPVCRLEEGLAYADSESSLSESPPPYSSGPSSDTDESGGLVWPQQLSPQLVSASGPGKAAGGQPKVFVKIKASHALKKKIMRFRSGSLKVMTTV